MRIIKQINKNISSINQYKINDRINIKNNFRIRKLRRIIYAVTMMGFDSTRLDYEMTMIRPYITMARLICNTHKYIIMISKIIKNGEHRNI